MSKNIYKKRTISPPASSRCAANTSKSPSTVTLSAAKGLSRWTARCFAEFTLSVAHVLSMTGLHLSVDEELSSSFESCLSGETCTKTGKCCGDQSASFLESTTVIDDFIYQRQSISNQRLGINTRLCLCFTHITPCHQPLQLLLFCTNHQPLTLTKSPGTTF